ncbi:hypothetical protein I4U23_027151 [Adineta vaga]|nr:hypothetical protein I4U23_027151 [Adineta vaga]
MTSNTITDTQKLARIVYSDGISTHMRQHYPKVYELLCWDLKNTATVLCIAGAFELWQFTKRLRYAQSGTDNIKTWSDYKKGIHEYLKSLNDDNRLEPARDILANHIHDVHFEKFPKWPSVLSESQESDIHIDISSTYPNDSWYVGWSFIGYIKISDTRSGLSSYYTDFEGKPELKILYCNERELKRFEALAQKDMEQVKTMIQSNTKELTFAELHEMMSR